jgi:hypothetical protein
MSENKNALELNTALKELWSGLEEEQKEKAKQCKSMDELTELAGKLGVELPDEMLETVAGGRPHSVYSPWDMDPSLSKSIWDC